MLALQRDDAEAIKSSSGIVPFAITIYLIHI